MKSPFPGMDPYLETRWLGVHTCLITYAHDALNRILPPGLVARAQERAIVAEDDIDKRDISPDVFVVERGPFAPTWAEDTGDVLVAEPIRVRVASDDIKQRFLEIRDARSGGKLITVIEFVSPTNKRPGDGLTKYRQKQDECRDGGVNLVEIDLTRGGDRSLIMPLNRIKVRDRTTYQAWLRSAKEPGAEFAYRLPLNQPLPAIPIPLRPTDKDILLELQPLIEQVYVNGRYSEDLDYSEPLQPPLTKSEMEWVAGLLKQAGLGTART